VNLYLLVVDPQSMPNQKQTRHTDGVEPLVRSLSFCIVKIQIPRPTENLPRWRPKASFPPILTLVLLVNTLMKLPALI
jgi:hypothetical protein